MNLKVTEREIDDIIESPSPLHALMFSADLATFIAYTHFAINGSNFVFKPFHLLVIKKLQDLADGNNKKRNLALCLPVGSGKTLLIQYFIVWTFCRSINNAYVYASHSSTNIMKLSRESKDMCEHKFLKSIFKLILKKDENSKTNWSFQGAINRTGLLATTMATGSTGADSGNPNIKDYSGGLMIDDPIDVGKIRRSLAMKEVNVFYDEKLATRRRTPTTPSVIVMQRLTINDLIAWLKMNEAEDWDFVEIPALNDKEESFWPERYPVEELKGIREKNPFKFYAQYQQQPIADGGNMIKEAWLNYYVDFLIEKFEKVFIVGDTAASKKESSDFTVFTVWGMNNKGLFLLDMIRGQWSSPELIRNANVLWGKWKNGVNDTICSGFHIEGGPSTSGKMLIDLLRVDTTHAIPLHELTPEGKDKVLRLEMVLGNIEAGQILLPKNNLKITDVVVAECVAFTRDDSHDNDDIVDNIIYAINVGLTERRDGLLFTF